MVLEYGSYRCNSSHGAGAYDVEGDLCGEKCPEDATQLVCKCPAGEVFNKSMCSCQIKV
jgi:hypothetical protein